MDEIKQAAIPILYEHPLNERMRVFMRLEYFFQEIAHFTHKQSIWDCQAAVFAFIEILNILDRNDVRSELLKELERHIVFLKGLLDTPDIDTEKLNATLSDLDEKLTAVHQISGKLGKELKQDDLLNNVRQRTSLSHWTCGFDLPAFYHWIHQPVSIRETRFEQWLEEFKPIQSSISSLLKFIRNSAEFKEYCAEEGVFQLSLDGQQPMQMVRIFLPAESHYFPEISGGKHRINIRFMEHINPQLRPTPTHDIVEFEMSCCGI